MKATQVKIKVGIEREQLARIDAKSAETGACRSALIRMAIDRLLPPKPAKKRKA